jgi:hypothetical protein
MAKDRKLTLTILGNAKGAMSALSGVGNAGESLGSKLGGLSKKAALAFTAISAGALVMGKKFVDAGSDLEESMSKVNVVFGDASQGVKDFAKTSATSLGLSQQKALEAAGTYGNLLKAFGLTNEQATDMSVNMVTLAADLASFNNTSVDDALLALRSGLSGETEPLKRFGVALNDVRLKEEAMRMGLITTTSGTLPIAIKTQAAYALILKDSALAQGDFARTSDGVANKQKIVAAQFADVSAQIGSALLPAFKSILDVVSTGVLPVLSGFGAAMQEGGFGAGIEFAIKTIKDLAPRMLQAFTTMFNNVVSWLSTDGKALIVRGFTFLSDAVTNWILPALPKLISDATALMMRVVTWFTSDGVGFIVKGMTRLGDAMIGFVKNSSPKLLQSLLKWTKGLITFLLDVALPNLVTNLQTLGAKMVEWIGVAARELPAQLITFLGELAGFLLSTAIPKLLELGGKLLLSLISWIPSLAKNLILGIGGAVVALVAALPDVFAGLFVGMGKIAVSLVGFFIDKWKMLGIKIAELAIGYVNFLIDMFNKIPLIPNIDKVTIDTDKLKKSMGLTAAEVATVGTSFKHADQSARRYATELADVANQTKGAKTSTDALNTALGDGAGGGKGTNNALKNAQEQLKKYTGALQTNEQRSRSAAQATKDMGKAADALKQSIGNVDKAQARFNMVIGGFPRTSKEAIEATKQLDQANRRLRDANIAQEDAVRNVTSAEKRLADLRALTADPATVADAERNLTRAKFSIEQANFNVIEAEKELAELRASPNANPIELRKREIAYEEAKLRVIEATLGEQQATKDLDDERNRAATPDEIAEAERDLEDAKLGVVDAIDEQRDATNELSDAQSNLDEVLNGAKEGSDAYKEALDALIEAKDKQVEASERMEEALLRERDAVRELANAQRELLTLQSTVSANIRKKGDAAFAKLNQPVTPMTGTTSGGMSMMSANGAGDTNVNINVTSGALSSPQETGSAVIEALGAYVRANGTIPINVGAFVGAI